MSYIDLSDSAVPEMERRIALYIEAITRDLRDAIVRYMEEAGPRTGHEYPMPDSDGTYTASAPGEPPAVRTGTYRDSWHTTQVVIANGQIVGAAVSNAMTEDSEHFIGELLEFGTNDVTTYSVRMEPRPHIRPAMEEIAQKYGGRIVDV